MTCAKLINKNHTPKQKNNKTRTVIHVSPMVTIHDNQTLVLTPE